MFVTVLFTAFIACIQAPLLPKCRKSELVREVVAMGTSLQLTVCAVDRAACLRASESALRAVEITEARLSSWRFDSELSRLNRSPAGQVVSLSAAFADDLARAQRWVVATGGAFDPGVGPLIFAWDLRGAGRIPSADELDRARSASGLRHLRLNDREACRRHAAMTLDAGAFGKGAALDAAAVALRAAGATARLDFGGQLLLVDCTQEIDIADPHDRSRVVARLTLRNKSVGTSGNGSRMRVIDGRRIGHLLDPRSGAPADDFGSVTVVADAAFDADCLSTALFVMGPDTALRWAEAMPGVDAVVVDSTVVEAGGIDAAPPAKTLRLRCTSGLRDQISILSPLTTR